MDDLPLKIRIERILSRTLVINYGQPINLYKFKNEWFEPEIFPALTIKKFKPLNVNVFASGKIVVTGVKSVDCDRLVNDIITYIQTNK